MSVGSTRLDEIRVNIPRIYFHDQTLLPNRRYNSFLLSILRSTDAVSLASELSHDNTEDMEAFIQQVMIIRRFERFTTVSERDFIAQNFHPLHVLTYSYRYRKWLSSRLLARWSPSQPECFSRFRWLGLQPSFGFVVIFLYHQPQEVRLRP